MLICISVKSEGHKMQDPGPHQKIFIGLPGLRRLFSLRGWGVTTTQPGTILQGLALCHDQTARYDQVSKQYIISKKEYYRLEYYRYHMISLSMFKVTIGFFQDKLCGCETTPVCSLCQRLFFHRERGVENAAATKPDEPNGQRAWHGRPKWMSILCKFHMNQNHDSSCGHGPSWFLVSARRDVQHPVCLK